MNLGARLEFLHRWFDRNWDHIWKSWKFLIESQSCFEDQDDNDEDYELMDDDNVLSFYEIAERYE